MKAKKIPSTIIAVFVMFLLFTSQSGAKGKTKEEVMAIYNSAGYTMMQIPEQQCKQAGAEGGLSCMSDEGGMAMFYFFSSPAAANKGKEGFSAMATYMPDWALKVDGQVLYMGPKAVVAIYEKGNATKNLAWPSTVPGLPKYPYGAISEIEVVKESDSDYFDYEKAFIQVSGTTAAEMEKYLQSLRQAGWWLDPTTGSSNGGMLFEGRALKDLYEVTIGGNGMFSFIQLIAHKEQSWPSDWPFQKPAGKKLIGVKAGTTGGETGGDIMDKDFWDSVVYTNSYYFTCINMSQAETDKYIKSLPKTVMYRGKRRDCETSVEQEGPRTHIVFSFQYPYHD